MAVFGLQWGIIPIIIININNNGYDLFTPMWLMASYAQIGVALGVFLKTRNAQLKQLSLTSFVTGLFTGVTEPIIYGLLTKFKKLHISFIAAGAIAGAFVGMMGVKQYTFVFAGILNFPGFFGDTFVYYLIGMGIAIVLGAVFTYLIRFEDGEKGTDKNVVPKTEDEEMIYAPVAGELVRLEDVKDEVFSSRSMGDGAAVVPYDGKILAPSDGILSVVFPTKHAYGITTDHGTEILIHFGIDTVNLEGKGFRSNVKQEQPVKKGDLLGEADLGILEAEGYDTTVMVVVTEANSHQMKMIAEGGKVTNASVLLQMK